MGCLGNIIWFLCGGLIAGLSWVAAGILWCCTIVGIPFGMQCFKIARLTFMPFGTEVEPGNSTVSLLGNIIWIIVTGWELALVHAVLGLVFCITIIGIPLGKQHFKLAKLALLPFGAALV